MTCGYRTRVVQWVCHDDPAWLVSWLPREVAFMTSEIVRLGGDIASTTWEVHPADGFYEIVGEALVAS